MSLYCKEDSGETQVFKYIKSFYSDEGNTLVSLFPGDKTLSNGLHENKGYFRLDTWRKLSSCKERCANIGYLKSFVVVKVFKNRFNKFVRNDSRQDQLFN